MFGLNPMELIIVSMTLLGAGQLPVGLPPLPPDPVVTRAAPEECLFYTSWNGTGVPDPKSSNQTEQLLAEPELQQFADQLVQRIEKVLQSTARSNPNPQAGVLAEALPSLLKTAAMRPGSLYISKVALNPAVSPPKVAVDAALVINAGDEAPRLRQSLAQLEGLLTGQVPVDKVELDGVAFKSVSLPAPAPPILWGFKDDVFVLAVGEDEAKAVLGRMSKSEKTPEWLATVGQRLKIERPASLMYINIAGILETAAPFIADPTAKKALDVLGISQLDYLASAQGLEGSGTLAKSLLTIKGEPKGLLKLLPAKPLEPADLELIPRSATSVNVVRLDPLDVYKTALDLASAFNPDAVERFETQLAQAEQQFGLKLVDDLLKPLGDRWTLYVSPELGGFWGMMASVTLDDAKRFATTQSRLLGIVQGALANQDRPPVRVHESEIEGVLVYTVQPKIPFFVAPSWAVTKDRLIVTLNRQAMKEVLGRSKHAESLADAHGVRHSLEKGPSMFSYLDTAELVKTLYPMLELLDPIISGAAAQAGVDFELPLLPSMSKILPHLMPAIGTMRRVDDGFYGEQFTSAPGTSLGMSMPLIGGFAVGLALPAMNKAREQARGQVSANNLKQLDLALQNVANLDGHLPAPFIADEQGKPLLSWRVAILPFVGEDELYRSFKLDEPWDSPHNRPLVGRMPACFADARRPDLVAAGRTRYLMPTGPGTLFSGDKGPTLDSIRDGTSNTILLVEAGPDLAVEWTRPQDVKIDPKNPAASLKLPPSGRLGVAMADGSVRTIAASIDPAILHSLFDPGDGEAVDADSLR